jgi:hypothetical protein
LEQLVEKFCLPADCVDSSLTLLSELMVPLGGRTASHKVTLMHTGLTLKAAVALFFEARKKGRSLSLVQLAAALNLEIATLNSTYLAIDAQIRWCISNDTEGSKVPHSY